MATPHDIIVNHLTNTLERSSEAVALHYWRESRTKLDGKAVVAMACPNWQKRILAGNLEIALRDVARLQYDVQTRVKGPRTRTVSHYFNVLIKALMEQEKFSNA